MDRIELPFAEGALIGMVHLGPLPGAPGFSGRVGGVLRRAAEDATALVEGGVDAVLIENRGDVPFHPGRVPAATVAWMTRAVRTVLEFAEVPVGVNVLRNDAEAALAVAHASGARFIRVNVHSGAAVTDQGIIRGQAHETLRIRAALGAQVAIMADVAVKHASPLGEAKPSRLAQDAWHRGLADALIVSGPATASAPTTAALTEVSEAVPGAPVLIGSGLATGNAKRLAPAACAAIVGTAVKQGGDIEAAVDLERVKALVAAWRAARA